MTNYGLFWPPTYLPLSGTSYALLNRAVAKATGEPVGTISHMRFQVLCTAAVGARRDFSFEGSGFSPLTGGLPVLLL